MRRRLLDKTVKKTAVGNPVIATDSVTRSNIKLEMNGKTEQITTTGAQLFDISKIISGSKVKVEDGKIIVNDALYGSAGKEPNKFKDYFPKAEVGKTYTLNFKDDRKFIYLLGSNITWKVGDSKKLTNEIINSTVYFYSFEGRVNTITDFMLNEGSSSLPYEPYTGGKPSPSPDYPQEIQNNIKSIKIDVEGEKPFSLRTL